MIVKNETKALKRCLESVKPLIDYWVICDTGSTDGTQELIMEVMKDIPGELHEHPWKDFGHNRTRALEAAKDKADYLIFIDADEEFVYPENYSMPHLDKDFYFITIKNERWGRVVSEYKRPLLIKTALDWKWVGVLHETLAPFDGRSGEVLWDIDNISRTEDGYRFQNPDKFLHDADVLVKALETEPDNTRHMFYAGQSYMNAHRPADALKYFKMRIEQNNEKSDELELFPALFLIGVLSENVQKGMEEIVDAYSRASLYAPNRAEPLYYMGSYLLTKNNFFLSELVLKKANELSVPKNEVHYVQEWIYEWGILYRLAECTYRIGKFDESRRYMQRALKIDALPEKERSALLENLQKINEMKQAS